MEIKLGGKKEGNVLVSVQDFDLLSKYSWQQNEKGYAQCSEKIKNSRLMHRIIMEPEMNKIVDHINHNRLDNRRENLRIITKPQNNQNRLKNKLKITTSKYKGVSYSKRYKKFRTTIKYNNKQKDIGIYEKEEEATKAYDIHVVHN